MGVTKAPPFTIVVDTREKWPYPFTGLATVRGTLHAGDYSLVGHESDVAVERKSKADAWTCVASERPRFEACLQRLASLRRAAIVIECDLREFSIRPEHIQRVTAATAVGSFISWSVKYQIQLFWCDTRPYAERVVVRYLVGYLKHVAGNNHQGDLIYEQTTIAGNQGGKADP